MVDERRSGTGACWIHGEERVGEKTSLLIDPSTGEVFAEAAVADAGLVELALKSAQESLHYWRSFPAMERSGILHELSHRMREEMETLASLICREAGKPILAARDEVLSAASTIDFFAEESLRLSGRIPLLGHPREQVLIVREPVGVVVAITPFNYPLSTLACKMAPALAVGCTVVAKPDEHTPLSTLRVAQLAHEAGLPPGVLNVVTGPGAETGRMLVEHPIPRLVTFTGSTAVGKEIQALSARWVRRVILELGGHCPAIVFGDAPWREVLPQILVQSMKNCGQYCYRASRIYVAESIYGDFLHSFINLANGLRVGPAHDPMTDVGPLNNANILSRVRAQVAAAVEEGARIEWSKELSGLPSEGFYYPPTVLTGVDSSMSIVQKEIFGPVVTISRFEETESAIREANATTYGLAAYLFSADLAKTLEWAKELEVGSVWINRIHQAYLEAPFGGVKESGLGREKSHYGIEEFTELKTIYLSY